MPTQLQSRSASLPKQWYQDGRPLSLSSKYKVGRLVPQSLHQLFHIPRPLNSIARIAKRASVSLILSQEFRNTPSAKDISTSHFQRYTPETRSDRETATIALSCIRPHPFVRVGLESLWCDYPLQSGQGISESFIIPAF
jgi:hypothetical protein